jgi:hypothetical protein
MTTPKDEIQNALSQLESTFLTYKGVKSRQSNAHPLGSPHRVEADLSQIEKAHLSLQESNLTAVIARQQLRALSEAANSSDRLGTRVLWLNVVVAILTAVMAFSSVLALVKHGP